MEFYLEAFKNDIDIASLECDIELDRSQLIIDYYTNQENFYKESGDSEYETFMFEAGNKIGNAIKNAFNKVIDFIRKCVNKVKELMSGKKIKNTTDKLEKALKDNPELKNKKITYKDYSKQTKALDEYSEKLKSGKVKGNNKEELEKIKKIGPTVVNITLGAAVATLGTLTGVFYKKSKDREKMLTDTKAQLETMKEKLGTTEEKLDKSESEKQKLSEKVATYKNVVGNHIQNTKDSNAIKKTREESNKKREEEKLKNIRSKANEMMHKTIGNANNLYYANMRRNENAASAYIGKKLDGSDSDMTKYNYYYDHYQMSTNLRRIAEDLVQTAKISTEHDLDGIRSFTMQIDSVINKLSNMIGQHDDKLIFDKDIKDEETWLKKAEKRLGKAKEDLKSAKTDEERDKLERKISEYEDNIAEIKSEIERLKKEHDNK